MMKVIRTEAFFVSKPGNYLVKQQDFEYQDGGKGSVFIMTDLGAVLPHYRNIIIQVCFAVVGVLILTSTFLSWFMLPGICRTDP